MWDRRYICYLTAEGVTCITAERDSILKQRLPLVRAMLAAARLPAETRRLESERKNLLRRVLYLNRLLHYRCPTPFRGVSA